MMTVLVTRAMSNNVLQEDTVIFSWLRAVQSIFINMNHSFPRLKQPDMSEDTGTVLMKLKSHWVDAAGLFLDNFAQLYSLQWIHGWTLINIYCNCKLCFIRISCTLCADTDSGHYSVLTVYFTW